MKKKKIKHMIIPFLQGVDYLDNYDESQFPVHVSPYVSGLEIVITNGQIKLAGEEGYVANINFREALQHLRDMSLDKMRPYTFHCSIHSPSINTIELYKAAKNGGSLPKDITTYVNDLVIEQYADKMVTEARVGTMRAVAHSTNMPNVKFNLPVQVGDIKSFFQTIDIFLENTAHFAGVKLWKIKGKYHEGINSIDPSSVIVDTTSFEKLKIVDIEGTRMHIGTDDVFGAKTILLDEGSTLPLEVSVEGLSRDAKHEIWLNKIDLKNRAYLINELVETPSNGVSFRKTGFKIVL